MTSNGPTSDPNCVFCAIVAGTGSAHIVREDDDTLAFLALGQAVPGHTLIVPKVHAVDMLDIEPDSLAVSCPATSMTA